MSIDFLTLFLLIPIIIFAFLFLFKYPEITFGLFVFAYVIKGGVNIGFFNLTAILLIIATFGFFSPMAIGKKILFKLQTSDFLILAFVIILLIGCFITSNLGSGFIKAIRFILIVLAPYFLARIFLRDWGKIRRFLITIFSVASVYAVLLTFLSIFGGYEGGRIEFLEVNQIPLATLLIIGLIMVTIGVLEHLFTKFKLVVICCIAIIPFFIYSIFLVGVRGPLFSAIIGLSFYFLLILKRRPKLTTVVVFTCILTIFFIIQNFDSIYSYTLEKIPNFKLYSLEEIKGGQSTLQRLRLYSLAIDSFFEKPILGIGTKGFAEIDSKSAYPHNIFLEIGAENGTIGLVFFICFLFTVGYYGVRYLIFYLSRFDKQTKTIVLTVLTVSLTLLIERQFSYSLTTNKDLFVFLALVVNLSQISKNLCFSKESVIQSIKL